MSKLLFQCFHWLTGPLMLIATFNHVLCITAPACNKYPLITQSFSAYCNVMLQVLYFVCFWRTSPFDWKLTCTSDPSNTLTLHFIDCMVILLQAAVIHQSMFKFLHIDDQDMVKSNLAWPKPNGKKTKTVSTCEVNYRMCLLWKGQPIYMILFSSSIFSMTCSSDNSYIKLGNSLGLKAICTTFDFFGVSDVEY